MKRLAMIFATALSACIHAGPDGLRETRWQLVALDGVAPDATVTLEFDAQDGAGGMAPCNSYGAQVLSEAPEFRLGPIRSTRSTCPEMTFESAYLDALAAMRGAEIAADRLSLTAPDGRRLDFIRQPSG